MSNKDQNTHLRGLLPHRDLFQLLLTPATGVSRCMIVVSTWSQNAHLKSWIMVSWLLDMEKKMDTNTGSLRTVGQKSGVRMVILRWLVIRTICVELLHLLAILLFKLILVSFFDCLWVFVIV